MPDTAAKSLTCPNCSAPLELDGDHQVVRCKFCMNVVLIEGIRSGKDSDEAEERLNIVSPDILDLLFKGDFNKAVTRYMEKYGVSQLLAKNAMDQILAGNLIAPPEVIGSQLSQHVQFQTFQPNASIKVNKKISLVTCLLPAFILLLVGGLIMFVMFQPGGPFKNKLNAYGPAVLLPSEGSNPADTVTQFYNVQKETRLVGRVSTTSGKLLWQSSLLPKDTFVDGLRTDGSLVYVANNQYLFALDGSDGSETWRTQLPDKLEYGPDSFVLIGDRLIVITSDRTIQAYNTQTGVMVWNRKLFGYDRKIRLMGENLVIMDYETEESYDYVLFFLNPANGETVKAFLPLCETYSSNLESLELDAGLILDQDGTSIFAIYNTSYGCIQRYDLQTNMLYWQVKREESFSFSSVGVFPLVDEGQIVFNEGNRLFLLQKRNGALEVLLDEPDYEVIPLMQSGEILLARMRKTKGSEVYELWALDISSRKVIWKMNLDDAKPLDPPNEYNSLIDSGESAWTWHPVEAGFLLLLFEGDPNQLRIKHINLEDGAASSEQVIAYKEIGGEFYSAPDLIAWNGNLLHFSLETRLYVLDVNSGEILMKFQ